MNFMKVCKTCGAVNNHPYRCYKCEERHGKTYSAANVIIQAHKGEKIMTALEQKLKAEGKQVER